MRQSATAPLNGLLLRMSKVHISFPSRLLSSKRFSKKPLLICSGLHLSMLAGPFSYIIQMPNFTEGDVSLSLSDKDNILTLANGIYNSIGETEKNIGEPIVYIGK